MPQSYVVQVLSWDQVTQGYFFRYSYGVGTNFPLKTGGSYWLEVDANAPAVASFVGNVPPQSPAQGSTRFDFVGDQTNCKWNQFSLPLDQGTITKASELLTAIGDAEQVLSWDPSSQGFFFRYYYGVGTDFPVRIGYPYAVCMYKSKTWPQ